MSEPTLVLLHGLLGGPSCFDRTLSHIPFASSRKVVRPTLSGHDVFTGTARTYATGHLAVASPIRGNARPESTDSSVAFTAEVIRIGELLRQQCSKPVDLVGYSLGGRLALGISIAYPSLVRRLILLSARRGLDDPEERRLRRRSDDGWARLIEEEGLDVFLARWWNQPLFSTIARCPAGILERELERRRQLSPDGLAWALRNLGLGSQPSYAEQVASLTIPVKLVTGSLDAKFCNLSQDLALQLPNSRAVVVNGHGHALLLEAPEAVGRAIAEE